LRRRRAEKREREKEGKKAKQRMSKLDHKGCHKGLRIKKHDLYTNVSRKRAKTKEEKKKREQAQGGRKKKATLA
jgi:hypothetical protein